MVRAQALMIQKRKTGSTGSAGGLREELISALLKFPGVLQTKPKARKR